MRYLAGLTTGALALATIAGSALADGMPSRAAAPPPPPPAPADRCAPGPWTGFYVGGNLGWAQLDGEFHDRDHFFSHKSRFDDDEDALTAGVQAGYNLQCGNVVFGFETDINWVNFDDGNHHRGHAWDSDHLRFRRDRSMDWFGTLRGRIGWTNDRLMVYATAGAAYTELDRGHRGWGLDWHNDYGWGVSDFHRDSDDVTWGFVGGGGIEWLWSPNLSFKAEALWIDFESGDNDRLLRFHGWDDHKKKEVTWEKRKRFDHDDDMVVVRVGLNYKFGYRAPPPYEPLK
jgi:outer membrane immunogenic protein